MLVFTITNAFTGWQINVRAYDDVFIVEQLGQDGLDMGLQRTFQTEPKAIGYAVLCS